MAITIKLANGTQHTVEVADFGVTVAELKKQIAETLEIPADEQRIILRGKVLKDEGVLSAVGMEDGNVIHVVRSKKNTAATSNPSAASTANISAPSSAVAAPAPTPSQAQPVPSAANPYAALMSTFGAPQAPTAGAGLPAMNPYGGMGMGGAGAGMDMFGAGAPNPQQAMEMMQNPMMQQMMQQALSNPQFMQYVIQSNPQLASMPPQQQQAIIEMMRNPQMMQLAMAMSGGLGGMPQGGPEATPQSAQGAAPQGAAPSPFGAGFNPAMFAPPVPQGNPREIYREQLQQLRDMGFPNEEANIAALQQAQGNVQFALERLLGA